MTENNAIRLSDEELSPDRCRRCGEVIQRMGGTHGLWYHADGRIECHAGTTAAPAPLGG
jgi:hypothetical protein